MKKVVINGLFFAQTLSGVQRYAIEILKELDKYVTNSTVEIAIPSDANISVKFNNIKVVTVGKLTGRAWEQIAYPIYLIRNKAVGLNLCNTAPLIRPDMIVIHDIGYKRRKEIEGVGNKWYKLLWRDIQNFFYCYLSMKIITVSNFSKSEILHFYKLNDSKITVIPNGWQHYLEIEDSNCIFEKHREIKKGEYYFAMSNMSKHKNFKWILECAKENKKDMFVIVGATNPRYFLNSLDLNSVDNVLYLGRVSDVDAKALMVGCKAFISPSLYEGFGIPPLEAMSVETNIIISNIEAHKEVFRDSAYYINPFIKSYVDLNLVMSGSVAPAKQVLDKYSWEKSSVLLLELINKYIG